MYSEFRLNNKNIVDIYPIKKQIKRWFNCKWGSINDHKKLVRDVSKIGH
ncbi:hypothetical protein HMPREF0216_01902 [Clostridium celatum DSM 1785]|uniref:Uncharacterized protein n=1 Tax=Clostridium celatum DSM 1785 TaxID=545697 RepID=L1QGK4_9CLOT|nr:hypothetical protein HMPREF0216_01902 [Clostridium celatum DSM 1785]